MTINPPKGKSPLIHHNNRVKDDLDNDEYFHLTCHVNANLRAKSEKGEFVELEKLLPRHALFREDHL